MMHTISLQIAKSKNVDSQRQYAAVSHNVVKPVSVAEQACLSPIGLQTLKISFIVIWLIYQVLEILPLS